MHHVDAGRRSLVVQRSHFLATAHPQFRHLATRHDAPLAGEILGGILEANHHAEVAFSDDGGMSIGVHPVEVDSEGLVTFQGNAESTGPGVVELVGGNGEIRFGSAGVRCGTGVVPDLDIGFRRAPGHVRRSREQDVQAENLHRVLVGSRGYQDSERLTGGVAGLHGQGHGANLRHSLLDVLLELVVLVGLALGRRRACQTGHHCKDHQQAIPPHRSSKETGLDYLFGYR